MPSNPTPTRQSRAERQKAIRGDAADLSADRAYINGYKQAFIDWNAVLSTNGRITDSGYIALQRALEAVQGRVKNAR